eukprot:TRINITY_DN20664_c0_g1_i2.p1 TRINITY_DN20664_c0_g1~~TRINITY_DN20664_c0_g1_i2.p1  ORF type:complete len:351 (+),score=82.24 TRINITY_DN20664_c0_g1_i2:60-1112(+)
MAARLKEPPPPRAKGVCCAAFASPPQAAVGDMARPRQARSSGVTALGRWRAGGLSSCALHRMLFLLLVFARPGGVQASMVVVKHYLTLGVTCCCVTTSLICGIIVVMFLLQKRLAPEEDDAWAEFEDEYGENATVEAFKARHSSTTAPEGSGRRLRNGSTYWGEEFVTTASPDAENETGNSTAGFGRAGSWATSVFQMFDAYQGPTCVDAALATFQVELYDEAKYANLTVPEVERQRQGLAWDRCRSVCEGFQGCGGYQVSKCSGAFECSLRAGGAATAAGQGSSRAVCERDSNETLIPAIESWCFVRSSAVAAEAATTAAAVAAADVAAANATVSQRSEDDGDGRVVVV